MDVRSDQHPPPDTGGPPPLPAPSDGPRARGGAGRDAEVMAIKRWERAPTRRSRWPLVLTLGAVLVVLLAAFAALTELNERQKGPTSIDVGEAFVRGICLAQEGDPRRPDDRRSGYGVAYELLTEKRRESLDFADFCEDFAVLTDRFGPIVGTEWVTRSRDTIRRSHEFRLFLGDAAKHQDDLSPFRLRLALFRGPDGRWNVESYTLLPDAEPSKR